MAFQRIRYSFSFSKTDTNINPRHCVFLFKKSKKEGLVPAVEKDPNVMGLVLDKVNFRFVVYVSGKPAYDSTNLLSGDQLDKTRITQSPDIGSTVLPNGQTTTKVVVYLSDKYKDSGVSIVVTSQKLMTPMLKYDNTLSSRDIRDLLMFDPKITPASAFRLHQIIDENQALRSLGIGLDLALIPNFSSSFGKGYGLWEISNNKKQELFSMNPDDFDLYIKLFYELVTFVVSLDIGIGFFPDSLLSIMGATGSGEAGGGFPKYSAAGATLCLVTKTFEGQRLRYDYSLSKNQDPEVVDPAIINPKTPTDLERLMERAKYNFMEYKAFLKDYVSKSMKKELKEGDPNLTEINNLDVTYSDYDLDKEVTLVDRICYLSSLTENQLSSEKSILSFNKNPSIEYETLTNFYSIIGKPVSITGLTKLKAFNTNSKDFEVYKIDEDDTVPPENTPPTLATTEGESTATPAAAKKYTNFYLILEKGVGITIESNGIYSVYGKVILPEWHKKFEYYNDAQDVLDILWGVQPKTKDFIREKTGEVGKLSEIKDPLVFLVVRNKLVFFKDNPTSNKIHARNKDILDGIIKETAPPPPTPPETLPEDQPTVPVQSPEGTVPDLIITNPPVRDYVIEYVGLVRSEKYFELVPGHGLKVRGDHGIFYLPEQEVALAQNRIQGELISPTIQLNPHKINNILNAGQSNILDGTKLKVVSNMGIDRDPVETIAFNAIYNLMRGGITGNLGGDLSYLFYTVVEGGELTPSLIAYKSNQVSCSAEYVTYFNGSNNQVYNFQNASAGQKTFTKDGDFTVDNAKVKDILGYYAINNLTSETAVQLDDLLKKETTMSADLEISFVNETQITTLCQISFKSKQDESNRGKTYPYALFYKNRDNSTYVPFGYKNSVGNIMPELFYLSGGNNYIKCKNISIDSTSFVKLVPVKGIDDVDSSGKISEITEIYIYGLNESLLKNPIAHMKLENGNQFIILESKSLEAQSKITAVVAATIDMADSQIYFPTVKETKETKIESNYRLEKLIDNEYIAKEEKSSRNKYYLLEFMDECQILEDNGPMFYMIGFLYDENGTPSNNLYCLPVPKNYLSSGKSIFSIHEVYNHFLNRSENGTDPDKGRFPFFDNLNSPDIENFRIAKGIENKQKVAAYSMGKSAIKFVFLTTIEGKIEGYFNTDIGTNWKKIPKIFCNNIFNYKEYKQEKKDGEAEPSITSKDYKNSDNINAIKVSCIKNNFDYCIYLFTLCEVLGSGYQILMKKIPFGSLLYFTENYKDYGDKDTLGDEDKLGLESLDLLKSEMPILAIGDPTNIVESTEVKIRIGNSQKNNENKYTQLNKLKNDMDFPDYFSTNNAYTTSVSTEIEENLTLLQNIDHSFDNKTGLFKIYYINNKGIRDCKVSRSSGLNWQSYEEY